MDKTVAANFIAFFIKIPMMGIYGKFKWIMDYEKKYSLAAKETSSDILFGGHSYPYQMENAIKLAGILFPYITWAK